MNTPKTEADLRELYNRVYTKDNRYGKQASRHSLIGDWLLEIFKGSEKETSILDAGCGRAHVVDMLRSQGFRAYGFDIASALTKERIDIQVCSYSQMSEKYRDNSYDVVVSSDVLEHLIDEDMVNRALADFVRIARKGVLITTANFSHMLMKGEADGDWDGDLHLFKRPFEWWRDRLREIPGARLARNNMFKKTFCFYLEITDADPS